MFKKYKNLIKFKGYYLEYKKNIRLLIFVMIMASSLGMLLPYFMSRRLISITSNLKDSVIIYALIVIITILFHHIFWYLWEKLGSILTNKVASDIRRDIISSFTNTEYLKIKKRTSGYYLERINDDVLEVSSFLSNILGTLVDTFTNLSFLILIFFLSFECGLIFTIGILVLYMIDLIKIKIDLKYTEILKLLSETFNTKINEDYKGIKDIKGLGIKKQVIIATTSISEEIALKQMKKDNVYALLSRIKTFLQYVLEAILIMYSVTYLIPSNKISVIILLMILDYSGFMYELIGFFAKIKEYFVRGNYKASRILEIINKNNYEKFGKKNNEIINNSISVKDLSYFYEGNHKVLNDISFNISKNSSTVFIGDSGSGKSTLFGLLTKLLSCENNKIFIGNKDINLFEEDYFREKICIVNQEPFMLNDTILNNIKIVKNNASFEEICNACKKANIYSEIMSFKDGFNTKIVENGNNLSGGQKQRISIARAILKDSPILLFDEPTSALDKKNQTKFLKTIQELKKEKIIIIIAHRISNYKDFDNVYKVENGRLLEVKTQ